MSDGAQLEQEILANHPDWESEEKSKRDEVLRDSKEDRTGAMAEYVCGQPGQVQRTTEGIG
jgi:hypothetical protein